MRFEITESVPQLCHGFTKAFFFSFDVSSPLVLEMVLKQFFHLLVLTEKNRNHSKTNQKNDKIMASKTLKKNFFL